MNEVPLCRQSGIEDLEPFNSVSYELQLGVLLVSRYGLLDGYVKSNWIIFELRDPRFIVYTQTICSTNIWQGIMQVIRYLFALR